MKPFVSIEADTSLFRASAVTGIKKSLAGVDGKIPITADTMKAVSQIDALKARMETLNRQLAEIRIGANGKPAEAAIRKLQLQLKTLADTLATISMEADTTRLDLAIRKEEGNLAKLNAQASHLTLDADEKKLAAKIAAAEAGLERLNEQASGLVIDADSKKMLSQIADMERQAFHLRAALGDPDAIILDVDKRAMQAKIDSLDANVLVLQEHMTGMVIDADDRALLRKIYAAEAELEALKALGDVPLIADAVALDAAIAASMARIEALRAEAADLKIGGKTDLAALAATEGRLLGLENAAKRLNPEIEATNRKLVTGARGFGRFGLGALGARVALFGGLSAVSGWHIALDAVIEGLAVIVPALVTAAAGLAAFGIAGSDAGRAVYNRLKNIHTVSDALNQVIPPMTGHLEDLHKQVRPQVWQLYGDAISIAHDKTGLFSDLAVKTGGVIDTFAARLTVLATTSGTGLDKFLASGSRDLSEFGRILRSLGDAFGKLIQVTEQTHIAETLLAIVGAAAKMFDIFTKIPLPLLATVVAIHGIYLWSGLAATGITRLLRPLNRLAESAAGTKLAGTAVKDLAAAGGDSRFARLGATFRDLGTNMKAIPGRAASAAKAVGTFLVSPWGLVAVGVAALAGLVFALSRTKSATDRAIDSINTMVAHSTDFTVINTLGAGLVQTNTKLAAANSQVAAGLKAMRDRMHSASAEAVQYGSNQNQVVESSRQLTTEHHKLVGELTLVTGRLSSVTQAFGTDGLAGAMALAHLAGVSVDDLLSKDGKVWAAAVQKIAGVVQGYANMGVGATSVGNAINVLTISQSDQLKNMQTLNSAFDQFTKIVSGPVTGFLSFANTLKRFGNDAGVAGAQMTGLGSGFKTTSKKMTDASLQLQSDFQDTFSAATQMADAMRLTGTAAGTQISSIKDIVQVMIPMAGSSKVAAAEISSLAQEAGGPATTNLKDLAKWAGKTKDPLNAAQKASGDAAISFFNMSQDAQKLGTALSEDLTADMAKAVDNAIGLQDAMNRFAKDLQNGTDITAAGHVDRKQLYDDLALVTGSGKSADSIIKAMTDRITANGDVSSKTHDARAQVNSDIQGLLNLAPSAAKDIDAVAASVKNHSDKSDAGRSARKKLIGDLVNSGVDASIAAGLVDDLRTAIGKLSGKQVPVGVNFSGTGTGTIRFQETGGSADFPIEKGSLAFHAAGGFISGGTPGKDSVLGMLMPGEVVVPTNMVKSGAVDHLRGMLPGFASGGSVGSVGDVMAHATGPRGIMPAGQSFMQNTEARFGRAVENAFAKAVIAKFKRDMNALGGSGSSIVNYARSFLGKIPYVFGGGSLSSGIDCSGFTQAVYGKFGIHAPRTSEAQFAWATRSGPVPGGLAFYVSPKGGPPPGHVAIVQDGSSVISQGGGLGPKIESLNFLPLMGTGVPKGGFPSDKGGGGNQAIFGGPGKGGRFSEAQLERLWLQARGRAGAAGSMAAIAIAESGGDPNAHNPSGATGLWQILGNPFPGNAFDPLTNARMAVAKYNASGFFPWISDPVAAGLIRHGITRAEGGLVGYASGGGVGALRSRLAAEQRAESAKYSGLVRSFASGPAKDRTRTVIGELRTLATRQGSEQAAYGAVAGGGLSNAELHHLGATARSEIRTASDQGLNKAHPLFAKDLRKYLSQIDATSSVNVPAGGTGGTGGTGGGAPALTPALRSKLAAAQAGERAKYFGLEHSFAIGPAKYRTKSTMQELATLAARQASELSAYQNIGGAGFTRSSLTHLGAAARGELGTASDKELSRNQAAGGHPIWAADLRRFLARISTLAGTPARAAGPPPGSVLPGGGKVPPAGPPLPKITHTFGGDVGNIIAPILAAALVPLGAARGGLIMDRGGWLQPGWNPPIYNGTGRPERVTPGNGAGGCNITFEVESSATEFDRFMTGWLAKKVKVKGAGDVQSAFGQPNIRFVRK